jgi:Uncharacterized alpha/beta hydrolase domain (DUF2235)
MCRSVRCGPDSSIDPADQIAFHDPGLGSQADGANIFKALRWIRNTVAQATRFGITRNLVDCYTALIQLWRPGDRNFLIVPHRVLMWRLHCASPRRHSVSLRDSDHPDSDGNAPLKRAMTPR